MSELIVTTKHLRTIPGFTQKGGFCIAGARALGVRYGLNFHDFASAGLPASVLEATGDPMALALVKWARECEARDGKL